MQSLQQKPRFKTNQQFEEWIAKEPPEQRAISLFRARQACYAAIESHRGRPLLVYASKFWDVHPNAPVGMDLSDIELFVDLVNTVPAQKTEVDVLVHSPGGSPEVAERIVGILRKRFQKVYFLIPHSAYSAATMLALSGNAILMHPNAVLGPVDPQINLPPQINGIPARSIQRGFEKIKEILNKEGAKSLPAYIPLLEKYTIHLLEICEDAQKLSKELVAQWLGQYMFGDKGDAAAEKTIAKIVDYFSNYDEQLLHSRPLTFDKLEPLGLSLNLAEGELCDLLWEAFILINGLFRMSPMIKLFENTSGVSFGRAFVLPTPAKS